MLDIEQLKQDYEDVFSSTKGKNVLSDIIASGALNRSIFNSDSLEMASDAGKQELALHIKDMATPQAEIKKSEAIT